ncbi:hypothetical protein SteCoe_35821 [Stentor coeruleus]|uniref:Uncharacterized protein n=1 Tax=Stentor coeruleus TaxID=5963 RepID=A0A1R2ARG8_9CILI|nr:hypothetical protein SteCoe_35821 [Stentor coeruleus]
MSLIVNTENLQTEDLKNTTYLQDLEKKMEIILSSLDNDSISPMNQATNNFFNDLELSSSKFNSQNSPIQTEDLIMDENIDFLLADSELPSDNVSFNLTKTEIASNGSSVFQSIQVSNILMNSVPHSNNESLSLNRKSYESVEPKAFYERNDSKLSHLRIPQLSAELCRQNSYTILNNLNLPFFTESQIKPQSEDLISNEGPVINEVLADSDASLESLYKHHDGLSSSLINTGRAFEILSEKQNTICSCIWCSIV